MFAAESAAERVDAVRPKCLLKSSTEICSSSESGLPVIGEDMLAW